MYFRNAGSKKDLRVSCWNEMMGFFSFPELFPKKDDEYTWRAQYNVKLYAVFGKNESFLREKLVLNQIGMIIDFTGEVSGSSPG